MEGVVELPNNQNATSTEGSAPWKMARNLARYRAQDDAGDPGSGSIVEADGERDIFASSRLK